MSELKKISPSNVYPDRPGHRTREWFIRLPEGIVADDLKDPAIWSKVQTDRAKVLARHDKLYMVASDESFAVEARVTEAGPTDAVLALQKILNMTSRLTQYFSDDKYRVDWNAGGFFCVIRKLDGVQMGGGFASEDLAIRHLKTMYPRQTE